MNNELRCYTFTNFMLSSIQQGIQSGHASMELVNKYILNEDSWDIQEMPAFVASWITDHKTIVCLNGGNAAGIRDIKAFFDQGTQNGSNTFPYAGFFEDEQSLDGALTSVAVILPARIFDTAAALRRAKYDSEIDVTWDHLLKELRVGFHEIDETGSPGIRIETFNEWERDFMNKLNQYSLAR